MPSEAELELMVYGSLGAALGLIGWAALGLIATWAGGWGFAAGITVAMGFPSMIFLLTFGGVVVYLEHNEENTCDN